MTGCSVQWDSQQKQWLASQELTCSPSFAKFAERMEGDTLRIGTRTLIGRCPELSNNLAGYTLK